MTEPVLSARGIVKSYGGIAALKSVSFDVRPGEVHALVGENGAGKSTLTRILGGSATPDRGEIRIGGQVAQLRGPGQARAAGIETVQQELELALSLSAAENVYLGMLPTRRGLVRRSAYTAGAASVLGSLGASFDPGTLVRDLSVSDRQVVEIARALVRKARILLLDEPTAALSPVEAERLLARVRALKEQGVGIVYISHRTDEVINLADRITVLRDGHNVGQFQRGDLDREALVAQILGKELSAVSFAKQPFGADACVAVESLTVGTEVKAVSFSAEAGRVTGFFGLLGAGQGAIAKALIGDIHASAQRCEILGRFGLPTSPRDAIACGIGYVPADRRHEGLALPLSIRENMMLASTKAMSRYGLVQFRRMRRKTADLSRTFDIRMRDIEQPVGDLSGGNQQKVVLARWTAAQSRLLLLDEPTRGVDVGARAEIYRDLRRFAQDGGSALVFSSDAEEVATVCDRVFVMRAGRIVAEMIGNDLTVDRIVSTALNHGASS